MLTFQCIHPGFENIVSILLENGANTRDKDSSGSTASGAASKNGHMKIADTILMHHVHSATTTTDSPEAATTSGIDELIYVIKLVFVEVKLTRIF